jgi:outer membrane immunogenic protein
MRARLLSAAVAACLAIILLPSCMAHAADKNMPLLSPPAPDEGPSWNRTGWYVGALAGLDAAQLGVDGTALSDQQFQAGGMVGYNWRLADHLVAGVEGDWMFSNVKASATAGLTTLTIQNRNLASLRARVGMPMGPGLIYVTGGAAFADHKLTSDTLGIVDTDQAWKVGLVVGAGVEMELTRSLFLRAEGLHYILPDDDHALGLGVLQSEDQQTVLRVGVGFKLN